MDLDIAAETRNANTIKTMVLNQLLEDKIITESESGLYTKNWHIVIVKKSWFKKIISGEKDGWSYKFVNMIVGDKFSPTNNIKL